MLKETIIIETVSALVVAMLFSTIFLFVAVDIGGNYMTNFTFMGERGYEATGILGIMFGLPIGGILGAYLARRQFFKSYQKLSSALGIGLIVGVVLLGLFLMVVQGF